MIGLGDSVAAAGTLKRYLLLKKMTGARHGTTIIQVLLRFRNRLNSDFPLIHVVQNSTTCLSINLY
jgi:hypothetical protein